MPLKDRDRSRPRRLVRLGIIRLGHLATKKYKNGREVTYPVQDDHFLLHDAADIAEVYGNNSRELDVMLPFPDIQRNFDGWYMVWAGGIQVCKGDGEYVEHASPMRVENKAGRNGKSKTSVYNIEGDTLVDGGVAQCSFSWNGSDFNAGDLVPCPGAAKGMYPHCAACKKSVILKVMMSKPELFRLGYYQVSTGSGRNYDTILGTLELISSDGARPVNGIPFKMRLVEESTTYIEDGKRHPTKKWFLQLEPDATFTRRLYVKGARALLTEPTLSKVDTFTGEIVEDADEGDMPPPYAEDGKPATSNWDEGAFDAGEDGPDPTVVESFSDDAPLPGIETRPWTAADTRRVLGAKITDKRANGGNAKFTTELDKYRSVVRGNLDMCFAGDKASTDKRHLLTTFVTGKASSNDLDAAEIETFHRWLASRPDDDGNWAPDPSSASEARAMAKAAAIAEGQQEMEL